MARPWIGLLLIALVLAAGCARSPEAEKARYLGRGDRYLQKAQYREAIIEYRNALRIDPSNVHAIQQLGLAHYQLGEAAQAFRFFLKTQELAPDNVEARLKLGTIYALGGKPKEAAEEAEAILGKDPKNLEALLLLATAATTPSDVDAALDRLGSVRTELGDRTKFQLALGVLYMRKGEPARAEQAFQEALAKEPRSIEAHTALAELDLARGDRAGAERELKAAAANAPLGSQPRIRLADFYVLARRPDEAKRVLVEITEKAPDYLPGWRRLAELALAEGKYEESLKALEPVLKKNPQDLDALFLQGRVRLAKGQTTEAVQDFQQVLKGEPGLAPVRHQLALAHLQALGITHFLRERGELAFQPRRAGRRIH